MNKPLAYIIDLDGTLYDNSHRQHLIPADRSNTAGWVEFNCACTDDVLREDIADLVRSILCSGREVIFLTGRGTAAREQTMQRLLKDFNFIDKPPLIMRPMDWHTSAAEFKGDAIQRILDAKGWSASQLIALEDDPSIVEVMRGMGVTVLHIDSKCCTVEKPHHNGMMQLSNELADAKAALRRLSAFARSHAGDIQYTGDHPIAVAEKLAGRELSGNTEQLDTAPAQFESLAGEPVSKPYKFPDIDPVEPNWCDVTGREAGIWAYGWREAIAYHNLPVIPEGSFPEVVLHMDQAQSVFLALKDKKVSERVNNPELGAMGATNIQVWTSKTGGELHFEASNGGCTLIIKSQGVTQ